MNRQAAETCAREFATLERRPYSVLCAGALHAFRPYQYDDESHHGFVCKVEPIQPARAEGGAA